MSEIVDNAFEVEAVILTDEEGNGKIGLFAGDALPHAVAPDAPNHSVYYRTNGEVYTLNGNGGALGNWEAHADEEHFAVPFYNFDGSKDNVIIITDHVNETHSIPFFDSFGLVDNIAVEEH